MKKSNKQTVESRILDVLFELYEKTKQDYTNLSITRVCYNNGVKATSVIKVIKSELVDCVGGRKYPRYKWKTIRPNTKMAHKVYEEHLKLQYIKDKKHRDKKLNNQSKLFDNSSKSNLTPLDKETLFLMNLIMDKHKVDFDGMLNIYLNQITEDKQQRFRAKQRAIKLYNEHIKVDNIGSKTKQVKEVKKGTRREEKKTISILWGLVKININNK